MVIAATRFLRGCLLWPLIMLLNAGNPAPVSAEDAQPRSAKESEAYTAAIARAVEEFQLGNYAEARGLFLQAHALYPNARTFRGIGLAAFELRSYAASVDNLEAALASTEKPLNEKLRAATKETLARARAFIARVKLKLTPRATQVMVDGIHAELLPRAPLLLEVGDHVLHFEAEGYAAERRALTIAGGEQVDLTVSLRPLQQRSDSSARRSRGADEDSSGTSSRHWYTSPWLWTSVAVIAAGAGVGIYFATRDEATTRASRAEPTALTPMGGVFQNLHSW